MEMTTQQTSFFDLICDSPNEVLLNSINEDNNSIDYDIEKMLECHISFHELQTDRIEFK